MSKQQQNENPNAALPGGVPEATEKCDSCAGRPTCEKWREDFPTEWVADNYITRREFTRFLVLTSGAAVVGNGYFAVKGALAASGLTRPESFPPARVCAESEIKPGEAKLFRYPTEADPAMLLRLGDGTLVAFRQRCTHLSCPVHFNAAAERLDCPCHNGAFDARTGRVLHGPPPRPLPMIALRVEGGEVHAVGLVPQGGHGSEKEG